MKNYELHFEAAKIVGKDKSCGSKIKYETEDKAIVAAESHNRWQKRKHDVEIYPCPFCGKWHLGKVIPVSVLEQIIKEISDENNSG